ncbi:KAP family P-loop domain protein [Leptospira interrogans serovar Zanoni str. LT2156]|uniref:KAP family P-loop domain protein n=1 Tax=Leptospira interrogans serovar Zanoni str. LT2156 TaxID=1001601 RepID=M6I123_LEPIR|nr:KAP family P-loop domain protein [Leptospira interrogans serovar Zanoni str. LT2156]
MNHILEIISKFVAIERPEFALLINGKWGSGKTYFIKNEVINNLKNKKAIYLSLNGLGNIDMISTRLLISYFNISESINIGHDIVKSLMDMADSAPYVKIGSNILKGMTNLTNKILSKKINLTNSLIIFDDLERVSPTLNIIDVLGYINTNFIENHNYNVIFLCDEQRISNIEYQVAKEKVIGRTLEFKYPIDEFIDGYLKGRYSTSPNFSCFLQKHRNAIVELFSRAKEENIRTYNFIFDSFRNIFSLVSKTKFSEYMPSLLQLFISISIEFKRGILTSADSKKYKGLDHLERNVSALLSQRSILKHMKGEVPQSESPYYEIFYGRYIEHSGIPWVFVKEIYTYILSGYYDKIELLNELKRDHEKKEKEWNVQLKKLYDFRDLEIGELAEVLKLIRKYIYEKKYEIVQLPNILHILSNINTIGFLEFDYEQIKIKIETLLQEYLEKIKTTDKDVEIFRSDYYLNSENPIIESAMQKIKEIESVSHERRLARNLSQFYTHLEDVLPDQFLNAYRSLRSEGLFVLLSKYGYANKIIHLKNRGIHNISSILDDMFLSISKPGSVYYNEKNALLEIAEEIRKASKTDAVDKMKKHLLNELSEKLLKSANHLEATKE